uniref:Pectinesterase n=1 Tax=Daucus carota subsp. sativus TaxID=79200 RepID=A0A162A9L4_DAUCS
MGYGRLGATELKSPGEFNPSASNSSIIVNKKSSKLRFVLICAVTLIVASGVSVGVLFGIRNKSDGGSQAEASHQKPSQAMSRACSKTRYPDLCVNSLLDFPGSVTASTTDLVHISVNMTLQHFGRALFTSTEINNLQMDKLTRAAYDDCLELLEDSVDQLSRSLTSVAPQQSRNGQAVGNNNDVLTWLSAAMTNQDTCTEGFEGVNTKVKNEMVDRLKDLSELVSNALAIFTATKDDDFSGIPIQNRRLLDTDTVSELDEFPQWLSPKDRRLLAAPVSAIQADIVVAKDGSGTVKTIVEAIKKVPEHSNRRGKSVGDSVTTFHTASFAATGAGFIARDISFENYAGPGRHQAVALRIGADHGVVYRCSIVGYQDTLYVHSNRQFYRECDIYGTVDFIFGNAAVVFQSCNIFARKPMPGQKNTITAQNRKDPNQNTGISIHACKILATGDLEASKGSFPTFLGRPWKLYSRTVYLMSNMGDHIHPRGWLEWSGNFALDTLYYGEYMNSGPGGAVGQRVKWPGYRVITSPVEAGRFTVGQFIFGSSWLPATGVAFVSGLTV